MDEITLISSLRGAWATREKLPPVGPDAFVSHANKVLYCPLSDEGTASCGVIERHENVFAWLEPRIAHVLAPDILSDRGRLFQLAVMLKTSYANVLTAHYESSVCADTDWTSIKGLYRNGHVVPAVMLACANTGKEDSACLPPCY
jgi:hypothetical protein